jgi:hypothetical protein
MFDQLTARGCAAFGMLLLILLALPMFADSYLVSYQGHKIVTHGVKQVAIGLRL